VPVRPEDLIEAADVSADALHSLTETDGDTRAGSLDWTCRQTLAHLGQLRYAATLARRASKPLPSVFVVVADAPMPDLVDCMISMAAVLAETARAAPATARGFHPAGLADATGFLAMAVDEILVHTYDVTCGLGRSFAPPDRLTRLTLDRLFPWWPQQSPSWPALLWANGRGTLPGHAPLGADWLWHCAPLDEWDGTIPRWDPLAASKATPPASTGSESSSQAHSHVSPTR
jgi:hypothetical protein